MMALLFYIHISSKLSAVMIRNFYRNKSRKQSLCGQQVLTCSCSAGQLPLQTRAPGPAVPRATCSPATRQALEEEPLANRWRQRSTADQPGAQRPSQGPDIQPQTHHRAQESEPRSEPCLTLPTTLPLLSGTCPPSLHGASAHAHRPSRAPEVRQNHSSLLYTSVYAHHTHTRARTHAYTLMCAHTTHMHVHAHTCLHSRVCTHHTHSTHTYTHPPHLHVCTHPRSAVQLCKEESLARVCVFVSLPASSSVSGSLLTPPLGSWKGVKGVISSRETSAGERLNWCVESLTSVSHATLLSFEKTKES